MTSLFPSPPPGLTEPERKFWESKSEDERRDIWLFEEYQAAGGYVLHGLFVNWLKARELAA